MERPPFYPPWATTPFQRVEKVRPGQLFSAGKRFPCDYGAAGETRRASESTAQAAEFGFHFEGYGPPNLSKWVLLLL